MNTKLRFLFRSVIGLLLSVIISIAGAFVFRQQILSWVIQKAGDKLQDRYQITLHVAEAQVEGLSGIHLQHISLAQQNKDTLFQCGQFTASFQIWPLLRGNIRPEKIFIDNTRVQLVKTSEQDNFTFFLQERKKGKDNSKELNYAKLADKLLDAVFGLVPAEMESKNLSVKVNLDSAVFNMSLPLLSIADRHFATQILLQENEDISRFTSSGKIDSRERDIEFSLKKTDTSRIQLPLIKTLSGTEAGFDEITFVFKQQHYKRGLLTVNGKAFVNGAYLNHPKIAPGEVNFKKAGIEFLTHIGKNYIEVDSSTQLTMNEWHTQLFARFDKDTSRKIQLALHALPFEAQTLFNSLPPGIFPNLNGIRVAGQLEYKMNFAIDVDHPDSISLQSMMPRNGFRIVTYGQTDLSKMNRPFTLPVYVNDLYLRTLDISATNPYFVPFELIPDFIKYSVLTAEDGAFMSHAGLNADAFRKSITTNIKTGKFKRGGSTISMQLVKNVFLNKNKTVSRKLEEMLIVWLLESQRITDKKRMLEVYFNIIEWGPNVYGIGEASAFYFNKKPAEITLNEAIFMASIVPSPKRFARSFDETGHLKNQEGYYRLLSNIMLHRGQISQSDRDSLKADVIINGPARNLIHIKADSILIDDDEILIMDHLSK